MNYKNILLAIDGSDVSHHALHEILKITKNQEANIKLVYVVDESVIYYGGPGFDYITMIEAYKQEGREVLQKAKTFLSTYPKLVVDEQLIELKPMQGRIAEAIVQVAKDWPADLLVLGTHGRRGFSRLFLGSVAENIIRIATTPVLLVRGPD